MPHFAKLTYCKDVCEKYKPRFLNKVGHCYSGTACQVEHDKTYSEDQCVCEIDEAVVGIQILMSVVVCYD